MRSHSQTGSLAGDVWVALRRSALRRQVDAIAAGTRTSLAVDLGDRDVEPVSLLDERIARLGTGSVELQRVATALKRTGAYDTAVDQLGAADVLRRVRSARLAGALRIEESVPWLGALLRAADAKTGDAAARALGRIGGTRAAEMLLRAARRRPHSPTLLIGLARAAPDLFLEGAISAPAKGTAREAAAVAAGLRRRMASIGPLRDLLMSGSPTERAAAQRALRSIAPHDRKACGSAA